VAGAGGRCARRKDREISRKGKERNRRKRNEASRQSVDWRGQKGNNPYSTSATRPPPESEAKAISTRPLIHWPTAHIHHHLHHPIFELDPLCTLTQSKPKPSEKP